jgi:hypothetical protein
MVVAYLRRSSPAIEERHLSAQPRLELVTSRVLCKHFDHYTRPHSTVAGPSEQRERHRVPTAELAHGSAANVASVDWSSDRLSQGDSGRICFVIFRSFYRQSQG